MKTQDLYNTLLLNRNYELYTHDGITQAYYNGTIEKKYEKFNISRRMTNYFIKLKTGFVVNLGSVHRVVKTG